MGQESIGFVSTATPVEESLVCDRAYHTNTVIQHLYHVVLGQLVCFCLAFLSSKP